MPATWEFTMELTAQLKFSCPTALTVSEAEKVCAWMDEVKDRITQRAKVEEEAGRQHPPMIWVSVPDKDRCSFVTSDGTGRRCINRTEIEEETGRPKRQCKGVCDLGPKPLDTDS